MAACDVVRIATRTLNAPGNIRHILKPIGSNATGPYSHAQVVMMGGRELERIHAPAVGGPVLGLGVGLLSRLVWRSHLSRWVLVGSLVTLALTVAGAQCAMCFFVGK